ncbi:MAG: Cu(I)/Ag(I) efflux system periplasmic protein CusF [Betaproteobacteria bacterium]|jgi:Cu/Ag efflux protein CusF|nr:Cu(I)/Ag(I) efflux system periplasmic protein CusF [Betaproteobacteria bacterium]
MKRFVLILFVILLSAPALAQMKGMDMKGMDMKTDKKDGTTHKAKGVVTRVDSAKDTVTIKHEPIASMNWPTMTMVFKVKDKAMLEKLKKDQKIDFEFVQQGKDYVVTSVK